MSLQLLFKGITCSNDILFNSAGRKVFKSVFVSYSNWPINAASCLI